MKIKGLLILTGLMIGLLVIAMNGTAVADKTVKVGVFCDRSGPTANVGVKVCPGVHDYFELLNSTGGLDGVKIDAIEIEHKYSVPMAVEGYKKFKDRDQVVLILSYGTPITEALTPFATKDKIPLITPGFGLSDSEDGVKYPYTYVGVASYHSQMSAALAYVKEAYKGTGKPKAAYVYYDNPAGRDPLPVLKAVAAKLGIDVVAEAGIAAPGIDVSAQMLQVQKADPDFIISHTFGKAPALVVKEAEKLGIKAPIIGFVWAFSEDEVKVAGPSTEGYMGFNYVIMPSDNPPIYDKIRKMYKDKGKNPPEEMDSVYYMRGLWIGSFISEGVKNALKIGKGQVTGEIVKKGLESVKDFTAGGLGAPTTITGEDHGGSRKVRLYKVQNGKFTLVKDWFEGPKP